MIYEGLSNSLEERHPEEVVRIRKEVDPEFGVSGILDRLEKDDKFPLVIFENVKGSSMPLIANYACQRQPASTGLGHGKGFRQRIPGRVPSAGIQSHPGPKWSIRVPSRRSSKRVKRWTSTKCPPASIMKITKPERPAYSMHYRFCVPCRCEFRCDSARLTFPNSPR